MRFKIKTFRGCREAIWLSQAREVALQMVTDIALDGFDESYQWAKVYDTWKNNVYHIKWME